MKIKSGTNSTFYLIASAIISCLVAQPAFSISKTKDYGYELEQMHRVYGHIDAVITRDGVRLKGRETDYTWTCTAPDWDLVLYSPSRKLVCRRTYSDWSEKGIRTALSLMSNEVFNDWPRVLVSQKKFRGLDTDVFFFPGKTKNGRAASLKLGKFADYTVATGMKLPDKAGKFMQALYDVPPAEGIPLAFNKLANSNAYGFGMQYNRTEERTVVLETLKIKKLERVVSVIPPKLVGYKQVPESDVVVKKGEMNDAFYGFLDPNTKDKDKSKSNSK